uniref:Uncharacterized protein n=1 Tax=Cajanus cajan TaxID=3821 RepID=A0A151SDY5_CAJCA|nr:hypothetical protein KK1_025030 [Cajanus cajan]
MANYHYLKPFKAFFLAILLVYLHFVGSSIAIRTMATMSPNESSELLKPKQHKDNNNVFNFFPKMVPIPPSGPSGRENAGWNPSPPSYLT